MALLMIFRYGRKFNFHVYDLLISLRSQVFLSIERLLNFTYHYIVVVEENYVMPRSFPPHGSCFHGYPITLHVTCETNKTEVTVSSHSNERFESVRQNIATKLECSAEGLQLYKNDKIVSLFLDHHNCNTRFFI